MKKIIKKTKGITLIALVVTIVILLILATVTINLTVGNNGLFGRTRNGVNEYKQAETNEGVKINSTFDIIDQAATGGTAGEKTVGKVADIKIKGALVTDNTELKDDNDNTVWLPKGFNIVTDSPTKVAEGIVISDVAGDDLANSKSGNQFVWIPVGTISTTGTGSNDKTITLGRYNFDTNGVARPWNATDTTCVEETSTEHTKSEYKNAIAKDIEAFKTSATSKGGYYLARYEAGVIGYDTTVSTDNSENLTSWTGYTNGTLVSQVGKQVWNYITQNKASELARGMYSTVNSDLVNSYAWDTAIVFIEQCGTESNHSNYANQKGESEDYELGTTGTKKLISPNVIDLQCNIYDMAGNVDEWSTETGYNGVYNCVYRSGIYDSLLSYTAGRYVFGTSNANVLTGFRPLLYL